MLKRQGGSDDRGSSTHGSSHSLNNDKRRGIALHTSSTPALNINNAFTILPPVNNIPPPPAAPTPYRIGIPTVAKDKKSSFVILAENHLPQPPSAHRSRSSSPSGRVSPFRGRGFKPPSQPNSRDPSPTRILRNATYTSKKPPVGKDGLPSRIPQISPSASPKRVPPQHGRRASISPGRPPLSPQRSIPVRNHPPPRSTNGSPRHQLHSVNPTYPLSSSLHHQVNTSIPPSSPRRQPSTNQSKTPLSQRRQPSINQSVTPSSPRRQPPKIQNNTPTSPRRQGYIPSVPRNNAVPTKNTLSPKRVGGTHQSRPQGRTPLVQRKNDQNNNGKHMVPPSPAPRERFMKAEKPRSRSQSPHTLTSPSRIPIQRKRGLSPGPNQPTGRPVGPTGKPPIAPKTPKPNPRILKTGPQDSKVDDFKQQQLETIKVTVDKPVAKDKLRPRLPLDTVVYAMPTMASPPSSTVTTTTSKPSDITATTTSIATATASRQTASVGDVATSLMERAASVTSLTTSLHSSMSTSMTTAVAATRLVASSTPKPEILSEMVAQSTSMSLLVSPPGKEKVAGEVKAVLENGTSQVLDAVVATVEKSPVTEILRNKASDMVVPNGHSSGGEMGVATSPKTPSLESITSAAGASGAATTASMGSVRTSSATSAATIRAVPDASPVITMAKRVVRGDPDMESLSANNLQSRQQAWDGRQVPGVVPTSNGVQPAPVAKTTGCCSGAIGRLCGRLNCCQTTPACCQKLNCCSSLKTPGCCTRIADWFRKLNCCKKLDCCSKLNCCKNVNCCKGLGDKLNCCKCKPLECCKKKPGTDGNDNKLHCCKKLDCCTGFSSCCRRTPRSLEEGEVPNSSCCFPCCSRKKTRSDNAEDIETGCFGRKGVACCGRKGTGCCGRKGSDVVKESTVGCCGKKKSGGAASTGCFSCCGKKGTSRGRNAKPGCCKVLRTALKACCATMFCMNMACCRARKDSEAEAIEAMRRRSNATRMSQKKKSIDPERLKLDATMVDSVSIIRASIPVLPVCLAWFCLFLNVFLPGTGTVLSGFFCLCFGRARFTQRDDVQGRMQACILDLIVGVGQAFTILFCLVGWGWSIWWGVIMVRLARKYNKLQKVDPNATASAAALPAPGAAGIAVAAVGTTPVIPAV